MTKKKRLFEVLDEMNQSDTKNKTQTVALCNAFVSAQKVKQGGTVTMGVPESVVMDLTFNSGKIPILLIIDKKEFDKLNEL